jgi:hypothetical protein
MTPHQLHLLLLQQLNKSSTSSNEFQACLHVKLACNQIVTLQLFSAEQAGLRQTTSAASQG